MSNEEEDKKEEYSREELVYLSKLYEKAQSFEKMISSINKFIKLDPKLTKEEGIFAKSSAVSQKNSLVIALSNEPLLVILYAIFITSSY